MYPSIASALSDKWVMFFHPKLPISQLTPVCNLDQCIDQINHNLKATGRQIRLWTAGDQDQAARLLWVNWIYSRLAVEPIRKPILVHNDHGRLMVDCGDTRLMALTLCRPSPAVSVLATDHAQNIDLYNDWIQIFDSADLLKVTGFSPDAHVDFRSGGDTCAIEWLEIGDQSTSHHLHDIDQRISMMQNYLDQQTKQFYFDRIWARSQIDWSIYAQDQAATD